MMARSSKAPSIGRIQKRKTNFFKSIIFGLQRAAGPYRRANSGNHVVQRIPFQSLYDDCGWAFPFRPLCRLFE
jgi:regulation of enolase protein 1 (concanavalin A-like superfamily)